MLKRGRFVWCAIHFIFCRNLSSQKKKNYRRITFILHNVQFGKRSKKNLDNFIEIKIMDKLRKDYRLISALKYKHGLTI